MVGLVIAEVARSFANFRLVATREAELLRELSAAHEVTATVPYHPGHVTDLQGPPPGTSSVRDADGSTEGRKPPSDKPESDAGS